ncbi:MAG: O-antigen polymerase [Gemmatimonadetes bacterium]|nr:O-antigen polymerase [Gemmatimonadota bacterium]
MTPRVNTLTMPPRLLMLYALLFMFPVRASLGFTTLGPLDFFAAAAGCWLVIGDRDVLARLTHDDVGLLFGGYLLAAFLSLSGVTELGLWLKEATKLLESAALYLGFSVIVARDKSPRRFEVAAKLWLVTMLVIIVISAVIQVRFMRTTIDPFSEPEVTRRYFRFGWGTYAYSNYFAGMLLVLLPLAFYGVSMARDRSTRVLCAVCVLLFGTSIVLTFSRGAMLAAAIGLIAMAVDSRPGRRLRMALVATMSACAISLLVFLPGARVIQFSGQSLDELSNSRTYIWRESLHRFAGHPLFGIGYGNFGAGGQEIAFGHNAIVQSLVETGVLGMVTYFLLVGGVWRIAVRAARLHRGHADEWLFRGVAIVVPIALVHNMVENTLMGGVLYAFLFWPVLAITLAANQPTLSATNLSAT